SCFSAGYSDSHQVHFAALPRPCVSMWGRIIGTLTEESTGFLKKAEISFCAATSAFSSTVLYR
ncbi:hypothetical protein, partial [Aliamphritea spongicola]|uniref:hypothetical protein n=1 Tax=Aliamphritea spongicola TaxID=707589 RepID=UPI00196B5088